MTSKAPSYITKNRLGIYYFQYCLPISFITHDIKSIKRIFRKSLRTRNRQHALKRSRILWLIMDELKLKYFANPELFGKAMKLLMEYEQYENAGWDEIEGKFLIYLDETEDFLLEQIIKYKLEQGQRNNDSHYIEFLEKSLPQIIKKTVHALSLEPEVLTQENIKLSFLIQEWLKFKESSLKKSSYVSVEKSINLFRDLITEICNHDPISTDLTEKTIREFRNFLEKLPAQRNAKKLSGKTLIELCNIKQNPIAIKTFKGYLAVAAEFLKWADREGYSINPKLIGILTQVRRTTNNDTIKVSSFSNDDLIKIFGVQEYVSGTAKRSSDYWVPLIALYM